MKSLRFCELRARPRAIDSPGAVIQGNYLHHDYYGGFSQGFNLKLDGSSSALAEHNVIRDSSWPLQSFGGEFRYNLMINSGHDFVRSLQSGAKLHHNIFAHEQAPESGYDGGVLLYGGEQNVVFDNNTFDAGGAVARFDAPAIAIASGVRLASIRNNVFAQFSPASWSSRSLIAGSKAESSVSGSRVAKGDYNAWHNPLASNTGRYMPGSSPATPAHTTSPAIRCSWARFRNCRVRSTRARCGRASTACRNCSATTGRSTRRARVHRSSTRVIRATGQATTSVPSVPALRTQPTGSAP